MSPCTILGRRTSTSLIVFPTASSLSSFTMVCTSGSSGMAPFYHPRSSDKMVSCQHKHLKGLFVHFCFMEGSFLPSSDAPLPLVCSSFLSTFLSSRLFRFAEIPCHRRCVMDSIFLLTKFLPAFEL